MDCGSLMPPSHDPLSPYNLPTTPYLDRISLVLGHYRLSRHQLKTPTETVWYHDGPFHITLTTPRAAPCIDSSYTRLRYP
jgi:hypothetical protein